MMEQHIQVLCLKDQQTNSQIMSKGDRKKKKILIENEVYIRKNIFLEHVTKNCFKMFPRQVYNCSTSKKAFKNMIKKK